MNNLIIKPKTIVIKKKNNFDANEVLLEKVNIDNFYFDEHHSFDIKVLINACTFASKINLILSEPCLCSSVYEELIWVSKYIEINIIAKDESIIDRYKSLNLGLQKVDNNVDFNYIHIETKTDTYDALIKDDYVKTNNYLNEVYFNHAKVDCYNFLVDKTKLYILNLMFTDKLKELIDASFKKNIDVYYIFSVKEFNLELLNKLLKLGVKTYVSTFVEQGIISLNKSNSVSEITLNEQGNFIENSVPYFKHFFGETYKFIEQNNFNLITDFNNLYDLKIRNISKLEIKPLKVVQKSVNFNNMGDFLAENFDKSLTEKHNDYSLEYAYVQYEYKLIPPKIEGKFGISKLYDSFIILKNKFDKLQNFNISKFKEESLRLDIKNNPLISLADHLINVKDFLSEVLSETKRFTDFHKNLSKILVYLKDFSDNLLDKLLTVYKLCAVENEGNKFTKFDDEIKGYEKTIKEKEELIAKNINVLENTNRINLLRHKIDHLNELKEKFNNNSNKRISTEEKSFIDICNKLISREVMNKNDDSLSNVINLKNITKLDILHEILRSYLYKLSLYLKDCIAILDEINSLDIPEGYIVYENEKNKRFIFIESTNEYENTKNMQVHYNLRCVVRS